ncbi:hypothetical protein Acr_04g0005520 [Actinidia rufa]|uniref:STAS domain-containing protein n=1 Tax=Actinidia rufa TaxID=165716 RepID=A0A7J0EH54_9ERIC|nr:hypothetical protein Acr_04g0005520 [Actinidia rufa]
MADFISRRVRVRGGAWARGRHSSSSSGARGVRGSDAPNFRQRVRARPASDFDAVWCWSFVSTRRIWCTQPRAMAAKKSQMEALHGCQREEDGAEQKCNPWGITGSTQHVAVCRGARLKRGICYGALRAQRAERVVCCEIRERQAKFESPKSHRSDFGGERKPISNSNQIQSAQKMAFEHTTRFVSLRRSSSTKPSQKSDAGRALTCRLKFGASDPRTPRAPEEEDECLPRPHTPPRTRTRPETKKALSEFFSTFQIHPRDADYAPRKPRMRNEMNRKMIGHIRQCIGHERGTTVAEQMSEFQSATGRGQKKRPEKRSQEGGHRGQEKRRDKKNCPRNKAQDQSSEAATTAMMASADEESDWISDSGNAYHLCRDREVFSTHVACEGLVRMANDAIIGKGQFGSAWQTGDHEGDREKLQEKEDWKAIPTEGECPDKRAAVRHRSSGISKMNGQRKQLLHKDTQSKRREYLMDELEGSTVEQERKEMLWDTCRSLFRHEKVQLVQNVHEEAQRREIESMYSDRRDVAETMEVELPVEEGNVSRILSCRSYRRAGSEVVGMDNLKNSEKSQMAARSHRWRLSMVKNGGTNELSLSSSSRSEAYKLRRFPEKKNGRSRNVTISFAKILLDSIRPGTEVLGRLPETDTFCDLKQYPMAIRTPGVSIIRINSGLLCFANANFIRERIMRWVIEEEGIEEIAIGRVHMVVLDMSNVMNIDTSAVDACFGSKMAGPCTSV